ncbi:DNA topoisomerase 3 [Dysgonomonas sp. ZJ709]|uniref:DNA topoisomerase 3 n=1 Tax=Dysgonomonas sp. ZJ709 TaxID=2709797 RepID=UPI0013EA1A21|nr:DNA topoisomerase 3 [Dysgonomonas sp. ZJ709]
MIAIIAEKPSVGKDIARVLGADVKKDGYYQGNGYLVTWGYGHLVSLALPEEYGSNSYDIDNLPIIPSSFKLVIKQTKITKGYKTDPGAKNQLSVIKYVFSKCSKIIVATDAGREGELIFRNIYNYLKCRKPFSRLWISSLTDSAIKTGFENLKEGSAYDSLYLSAQARSQADWLVGINASRALCIMTDNGNNSLGRVQTPTLALICKRYTEHVNFKPEPFWQAVVKLKKGDVIFPVQYKENFLDQQVAENLFKEMKKYTVGKVVKVEKKASKQQAPLLHDLTSLQKTANIRHGFSADKTLSLAQKLYESKLISYPRTGSQYIPQDVFETIPALIDVLTTHSFFSQYATYLTLMKLNTRSVDDKKVTDHHALLITENKANKLSDDERIIYEMIAGRILEAFSIPCLKDVTDVEVSLDNMVFKTKGSIIKEKGWRNVFNNPDDDDEKETDHLLPPLQEGDYLPIESFNLLQKSTKAKPLFTEASLLAAMETAGKEIEDKELSLAIKDCGIGTPATRASIIETLFNREYIDRHKKTLLPTKKGMALYKIVKTMQIADVEMTGSWEQALLQIENKPEYYTSFMGGIKVLCATNELLRE